MEASHSFRFELITGPISAGWKIRHLREVLATDVTSEFGRIGGFTVSNLLKSFEPAADATASTKRMPELAAVPTPELCSVRISLWPPRNSGSNCSVLPAKIEVSCGDTQ